MWAEVLDLREEGSSKKLEFYKQTLINYLKNQTVKGYRNGILMKTEKNAKYSRIFENMMYLFITYIVALTFVVRLSFSKRLLWNTNMYRVVAMIKEWSCIWINPVFLRTIAIWQPVSPRIFFWGWIQNPRII